MDITTLNDRHLYEATVTVADVDDPTGTPELPDRIVRFGAAGWLTARTSEGDSTSIDMYPLHRVVLVHRLKELPVGDAVH